MTAFYLSSALMQYSLLAKFFEGWLIRVLVRLEMCLKLKLVSAHSFIYHLWYTCVFE